MQVSIAVFFRALRKNFWAKMAQPPRKKWPVRLWKHFRVVTAVLFQIYWGRVSEIKLKQKAPLIGWTGENRLLMPPQSYTRFRPNAALWGDSFYDLSFCSSWLTALRPLHSRSRHTFYNVGLLARFLPGFILICRSCRVDEPVRYIDQ